MSLYTKHSAVLKEVNELHTKTAGILKEVQQVYQKRSGVLDLVYQNEVQVTLNSAENVNLQAELIALGVKPNANVRVNIPAGEIIGGTVHGGHALEMGNISSYKSVVLEVEGSIYGQGGVNSRRGGSGALNSEHPFTLLVKPTGEIFAGCGAGGAGGLGGSGNDINAYNAEQFREVYGHMYYSWSWGFGDAWYDEAYVGSVASNPNQQFIFKSGYTYAPGSHAWGSLYYIKRAAGPYWGSRGAGGAGGNGQGYNQAKSNGAGGGSGTRRAGTGGTGGNGGQWSGTLSGSNGNTGGGGLYYGIYSSDLASNGNGGGGGGGVGWAIDTPGDVEIQYLNEGSVLGNTDFIEIPVEE